MSIKSFRERSPIVIGIVSLIVIALAMTFSFYIDRIPAIKRAYEIKAEFADAAGLASENQVRVAGIKVGTVRAVELAGDRVLVTMEIENDIRIPEGSFAEIKLATLLGTKFVDIDARGGGPYIQPGETIPLERTQVPYEIYQAANQGTAVVADIDGDAVNALLEELAKVIEESKEEIGVALEGLNELGAGLNANDDKLRSLLSGANDLTDLLAGEGKDLVRLIDSSNDVLASLARKREDIQGLLESTKFMASELTALVRTHKGRVGNILAKLDRALTVLERDIEHIDMAFEYIGPSSRYLGGLFTQGPWTDIFVCARVFSRTCESDEQ